jgi:hypothetical protein
LRLVWKLEKYTSMILKRSWLARGTFLYMSGANESADESRIYTSHKHTGPVRGLDFNPIQKNLLASGAVNAEVSSVVHSAPTRLILDLHLRPKQPCQRARHARTSLQQVRRNHIPTMEPYCCSYSCCIIFIRIHFCLGSESW